MEQKLKSTLQEKLYWREQFLNFSGETTLCHDYKRSLSWDGKYAVIEKQLPKALSENLNRLTQHHPLSLFILFSTAWSILCHLYTGETDIVIATPVYKAEPNLKDNIVCLRVKLDPQQSFKELLLQVRNTVLDAFKHQSLSYEDVLNEIGLKRKKNRSTPFCSILFIPQIQPIPSKNRYRSDLFVSFNIGNDTKIKIEYASSLFRSQMIDYLILHFSNILSVVSENVSVRIENISCLTETEINLFQSKLSALEHSSTKMPCLHEAFEEIAGKYADKIAIEFHHEKISYKVLNEKANCIAHELIEKKKVNKGQFIGFIGERSIEYCIAILGILKAGCAFVPIDSSYPSKRIYTILEDSQIEVVLSTSKIIENLSPDIARFNFQWIDVNNLIYYQTHYPNPHQQVDQFQCAYMIYTSGSTGKPKGAMIRHEGKMNHILSSHASLALTTESHCLLSASISSDISIWQALVALLCGGKTVIIDNETLFDYERLWAYIEEKNVHVMQFVPTFAQALLTQMDYHQSIPFISHLKTLILSGENIPLKLIHHWFKYFERIPILNAYGPTEASDIVCLQLFDQPIELSIQNTPIGKPLPNIEVFILDQKKRIQPFYVPGEIYIAGVAVGNGYWQDESKTQLSFIDNPFEAKSSYRWYRTGDYGRLLPDGCVEYMGRIDSQIKLRGFRIELEEIENSLIQSGWVKQSKVMMKIVNGNECLCAYIVLLHHEQERMNLRERLKNYLSDYLPDYMIPHYFYFLEKFPLLPGGKIDTVNLPDPLHQEEKKELALPQNDLDRQLTQIVSHVIGVVQQAVGMQSNFFEIGGTSIHLMAMKYQIKDKMAVDVPIERLFRMSTIQEIADFIRSR